MTSSKILIDNITNQRFDSIYQELMKDIIVLEQYQHLSDQFRNDYYSLVESEMSWVHIKPLFIEVYSQLFTHPEIEEIVEFYSSPTGKKLLNLMPVLMQDLEPKIQKLINDFQPRIIELQMEFVNELNSQMERDSKGY